VRFLFALCGGHIAPILVAAKARGLRVVDTRHEATAVFAADARGTSDRPAGRGRGDRGPRRHQHDHGSRERPARAVSAGSDRGRDGDSLAWPRSAPDIDQMPLVRPHVKRAVASRAWASSLPRSRRRSGWRRPECPARCSSSCPGGSRLPRGSRARVVSCANAECAARPGGARRTLYVDRHLRQAVRCAGTSRGRRAGGSRQACISRGARGRGRAQVRQTARLLQRAERPPPPGGSQALLDPAQREPARCRDSQPRHAGLFLGMARGLLGAADPLQLAARTKRGAARGGSRRLGRGLVRLPSRLRPPDRAARGPGVRQSQSPGPGENRRPTVAAFGAPDLFLRRLAARAVPRATWRSWQETLRGREEARDSAIAAQGVAAVGGGLNPDRPLPGYRSPARGDECRGRGRRRLRGHRLLRRAPARPRSPGWTPGLSDARRRRRVSRWE